MFQQTSRRAISLALLLVASITFQSFAFMPGTVVLAQKIKPLKRPAAKPTAGTPTPLAPPSASITATKVDAWDDTATPDGKAEPGQTITYTVTITNTGGTAATGVVFTDTIDPNTTLVGGSVQTQPIAVADSYNVIGNVRIQPTAVNGLLANDSDPDTGNNTGLTASGPTTSTQGGNVTINADGSFSYNPPVGFAGTDTFTYTITDATAKTDTAVATFKVGNGTATPGTNVIWFVNPAAAPGGDGRLTSPFNCYTGTNVPAVSTCFSATAADDPGDIIFLFSGAHVGGNTLLNNQKLVGAGASATLATITGFTVPTDSDALPATGGANPTITTTNVNAIPLGQGNLLRGFTVGNVGTGTKISGTSFGTLTMGDSTTPDVILNGTGQALSLATGTLSVAGGLASLTTTSSSGPGISLAGVADSDGAGGGSFGFGSTTISGNTTQCMLIGTTTADLNFGNTSCSGGSDGVSLQNNSGGTRAFGTLSISNNSGVGFLAAAGGNVNVAGATLIPAAAQTAPVGTGIDIQSQASGTSVSFAATTVNKGNAGTGVNLGGVATGNVGNVIFNSLSITTSNGSGLVAAGNTGSTTVSTNAGSITSTNGPAINFTKAGAPASPITLNFTAVSSTNSGTQGINIDRVSGNLTITTTTTTNPTGIGISVLNTSAGGTMNFGNTTSNTSAGTGVSLGTNAGGVTFNALNIAPDASVAGFSVAGSTGTTTSSSGTITTTDAPAVSVTNSLLNMILTSVSADNTGDPDSCVSLTTASGTLTMNGGALVGGTGAAFFVSGGNPTVTYSGSITQNSAARVVNIDGTTGNSITFNTGTITGGASSTGVNINNANGSVTFANLNLGTSGARMTNQAVTIAGGSGAKTLGTVSIFTTGAAEGIHSTTTTGAISITTGDVNSAGAAAINIAGTSAATRTPLNIQLTSISANGGTKGLILLNTSATGAPGGFRVNGTGTTDGTGGTIQNTTTRGADIQAVDSLVLKNMNFTNANSSVDGGGAGVCDDLTLTGCNSAIYLSNVTTLGTLDNLNITGTMVENGITAIGVANFKFDNSLIDGAGNEPNESGIEAQNLSGTSTVNNTEIRFSETDAFAVVNTNTSVNLTISGSTFRDSQTQFSGGPVNINGEGGFQFRSFGTGTITINVLNSSFLRLRTQGIQVFAQDTSTINLDIVGNTIDAQADIGTGIDINADDTATLNFNITGNPTIQSRGGAAVNITSFLSGHIEGRVNNNPDIEVLGGAGIPVRVVAQETSNAIILIDNNIVSNVNGTEDTDIDVQSRFQTARADVTITRNTVTGETTGVAGINLISGSSTAGESNITCGDVGGTALGNNVTNAAGNGLRAFRVRVSDLSNTNRLFLRGFVEAGTASQDTEATWSSRGNTPTGIAEVTASLTGTAVGPLAPPGGVCQVVDTATDFGPVQIGNNNSVFVDDSITRQKTNENPFARASVSGAQSKPTALTVEAEPEQQVSAASSHQNSVLRAKVDDARPVGIAAKLNHISDSGTTTSSTVKKSAEVTHAAPFTPLNGETVNVTIGTLAAGDSVTITFQVVVDMPYSGGPNVSNQGQVDGTISAVAFTNLTDDPAVGGTTDPTLTPINSTNIRINDAKQAEPPSGTNTMLFTVTLTAPAPGGGLTVNYASANGGGTPATGGASCDGSTDYITTSGTATIAAGSKTGTIPVTICADANVEGDETMLMNITSPSTGNITDAQGVGTITANTAGTFLISELRTSGPAGLGDDYVEVYNNTESPLTVAASDASAGYGLYKMGADCGSTPVLIATIPNGTVIPARGHYLIVGSQYSLANYGGTGAAAGNLTMSSDIESDGNVAVFSTANVDAISSANRLDAVGFGTNTGNVCDLLREGTNLGAVSGSTTEHAFFRKECAYAGGCTTAGTPKDTNDNSADLMFADTQGTFISGVGQRLGAPGPQNLASAIKRDLQGLNVVLLDASVSNSVAPNRVRSFTSDPGNNSTFGTLTIRRRVQNSTGAAVTRLRFRVVEMTTFPSPGGGIADLRARTGVIEVGVGPVNDAVTCTASGAGSPPCTVTVQGTTLEAPPTQPSGGGYNSSLSAGTITLGTPLANGASVNVNFLLGVQTTGTFRFLIIVEALP